MTDLIGYTEKDHLFTQLGLGPTVVRRDDAPELAPGALDARHQQRCLRAVERRRPRPRPRHRRRQKALSTTLCRGE
ncbi:hypothetical protein OG259_38785 [Streptomyces sp. NBC_00250]|uniref:hypothetical protein n=1 Tax=Streptomyces sp. NBC_00250 TaxID=2903641 RepID=UPI002E2DF111|nr:hypothetical protein [Streptomyces sp. NBC_00250]